MKEHQEIPTSNTKLAYADQDDGLFGSTQLSNAADQDQKIKSKIIQISGEGAINGIPESLILHTQENKITKQTSGLLLLDNPEAKIAATSHPNCPTLFRLLVKNGEYVYARPNDIILIESCDHLVKVHLAFNEKVKKTVRNNTLKDFLLLLPQDQFMRIGRFCAVNMHRLSGGNFNEQTFEFDFKISVKLKHPVANTVYNGIGQ